MDYKELLRKYIAHVWSEEGTPCIPIITRDDFTKKEISELRSLAGASRVPKLVHRTTEK